MRRHAFAIALAAATSLLASIAAAEQSCTAADYAAAVDRSGAQLSKASREVQPKIQERMRTLQKLKGLPADDYESAALESIQDSKLSDLDARSSELLLQIDAMGRLPAGKPPNCAEVADIDKLGAELLTVVRAKSDHIMARLDSEIKAAGGPAAAKEPKPAPAPAKDAAAPAQAAKEPPKAKEQPAEKKTAETWSGGTVAKPDDAYKPPAVATPAPEAMPAPQPAPGDAEAGYSIEEVQAATRGFFGTISTGLASVIEHAFKTSGRPTAYVLGTEGGGAFLAGLRFGEGTLYMRNNAETRKVWWHGPSIGGDFGASGTRTMFLIYKLPNEEALYRRFTGVDGSAFFVGGVGMTVLKGGDVIMAPIRTGIGLRVGASVGYVRFTPKPTWNPF
jgi:hypothetical protein